MEVFPRLPGMHLRAIVGVVWVMGCTQPLAMATKKQLARRASFDLECSADALKYSDIDWRTIGVAGCGKRAVYLESCDGPRESGSTTCTWIINGVLESTASDSNGSERRTDESTKRPPLGPPTSKPDASPAPHRPPRYAPARGS
jgi:hypothetical protein